MARQDTAQGNDFFDPGLPEANLPDFTRSSRGYDSSATAVAKGLSGAGDIFKMAVDAKDQYYKRTIRDEVTSATDTLRDAHIDDLTTMKYVMDAARLSPKTGAPRDLDAQLMRLSVLGDARNSGKVSDTQYYTQLDIMTRGMRAKYPGYREHIDNVVKDLTGVDPANRLISELRSEIANRVDPTEKEYNQLVEWGTKQGHLPMDFHARKQGGNPYSLDELQYTIARETRANADTQQKLTALKLNDANREEVQKVASETARSGISRLGAGLLDTAIGGLGMDMRKLQEMTAKATTGNISNDERMQLDAAFNAFTTRWNAEFENFVNKPLNKNGDSYKSMMTTKDIEDLRKSHGDSLEFIKQSLYNRDYGSVLAMKRWNEVIKDGTTHKLLQESPVFAHLNGIKELAGPEFVNSFLNNPNNVKAFTAVQKSLNLAAVSQSVVSGKPLPELISNLNENTKDAKLTQQTIDDITKAFLDSGTKKEGLSNIVNTFFGQGSMNVLNSTRTDQQIPLYQKLTSPEIANRVMQMRAAGDEAAYKKYDTWVKHSFMSLFTKEAQDIKSIMVNRSMIDVKFDPVSNQFQVLPRAVPPTSMTNPGTVGAGNALDSILNDGRAKDSVDKINAQIRGLVPVLKATGQDPSVALTNVVKLMVGNPGTFQGNASITLLEAFMGALQDTVSMAGKNKALVK